MIPQISTAKLIGFGVGLVVVLGFVWQALSWKSERDSLRDWQAVTVSAARDASGNPKLLARDVPQQVRALGASLSDVTGALKRLSAATEVLAKATEDQQRNATQAVQEARQRAKGPEASAGVLTASSRSSERLAKPCEPSEALKEAWK